MAVWVYVAVYVGLLIFLAGCLRRFLEYARTPLHLRWELYPVPHEEPSRVDHGGSYFESGEWWLSSQSVHRGREWTTMFREILYLKGLRENNPRLWLFSYLFHSGLYLSIVTAVLAALAVMAGMLIPGKYPARFLAAIFEVCAWSGSVAGILILIGALWLLVRRIADPALRSYTKAGDIFNLLFFIVTSALLVGGYLARAPGTASLGEIAGGVIHFDRGIRIGTGLGAGLVLASALAAYIPFTHMSHFIAKYFTWHSVRWDDRRNDRGSAIETRTALSLNYRPTWAASHIGADGKKTWAEIAAINPAQEVRK